MRYIMEIKETLTRRVPVEASCSEEAYEVVEALYHEREEIVLCSEDLVDSEINTVAEPVEKLFFTGSIILTGNRILHVSRVSNGFEWYFETKEDFSPTVSIKSDAKTIEEILPNLLEEAGVKSEEIVGKYNGFQDYYSLLMDEDQKPYSLKDIEEGQYD